MIVERQTIPHLNALVDGSKMSGEELCSSFRGCQATSPLKSVFFTRKVAWQPLIKLHGWAWHILMPTSRAKKWGIICLCSLSGSLSNPLQRGGLRLTQYSVLKLCSLIFAPFICLPGSTLGGVPLEWIWMHDDVGLKMRSVPFCEIKIDQIALLRRGRGNGMKVPYLAFAWQNFSEITFQTLLVIVTLNDILINYH